MAQATLRARSAFGCERRRPSRLLAALAEWRRERRELREWLRRNPPSVGRETGCRV